MTKFRTGQVYSAPYLSLKYDIQADPHRKVLRRKSISNSADSVDALY